MEALEMPEEKRTIHALLMAQREFVIDPNTGDVTRRNAWEEINRLLDCQQDLARLAMGVEL